MSEAAIRLAAQLSDCGLHPLVYTEPKRGYVVAYSLLQSVGAARARAFAAWLVHRLGRVPSSVTCELIPAQESTRPDKPGTAALLPLGIDPRSGQRSWLLGLDLEPLLDPARALQDHPSGEPQRLAEALGAKRAPQPASPVSPLAPETIPSARTPLAGALGGSTIHEKPALDPVALVTSPFQELPRALDVYEGCNVLRHFVDKAIAGRGLESSERAFVTDALGRLGDESALAVEAVARHLDDYRPGVGQRWIHKLYPRPTSCGRTRQNHPELTARVGCDCRFRVPPGAYPTPVLHAVGAAHVPGLEDRVREAASRGGVARAALAAMNEGRKEMGARAAALCARLSELRRQAKTLEKTIAEVERDLDALVDEAGDEPLETPGGTLRRVMDGTRRKFVLDV